MSPFWIWAIALAGYAVYWLTDFRRQAKKLPRLLAKAKALGCPTNSEDYARLLPVPNDQNAAPVYERLVETWREVKVGQPDAYSIVLESIFTNRPDPNRLRWACDQLAPLVALLEEAAYFPRFRFNRLLHKDDDISGELAQALRVASKVLGFSAILEAEAGNHVAAIWRLELFRTIVDHSLYEPSILSWIVHVSQASRWLTVLAEVAKSIDTFEEFVAAESAFEQAPSLPSIRDYIIGEVPITLRAYRSSNDDWIAVFGQSPPFPLMLSYFQSEVARDAFIARDIQTVIRCVENWPETETNVVRLGQLLQPLYKGGSWLAAPSFAWRIYRYNPVDSITSYDVRLRLMKVGLALLKIRLSGAELPKNLCQFGELAVNPQNRAPFVYSVDGNTFMLRSGIFKF